MQYFIGLLLLAKIKLLLRINNKKSKELMLLLWSGIFFWMQISKEKIVSQENSVFILWINQFSWKNSKKMLFSLKIIFPIYSIYSFVVIQFNLDRHEKSFNRFVNHRLSTFFYSIKGKKNLEKIFQNRTHIQHSITINKIENS